jgi:glycosyltransferase involved in cell wall biosynthesis
MNLDESQDESTTTFGRPIAVQMAITELDPGGAEKNFVELALRLDRRRFRPSVVSLAPYGKLTQRLLDADIPVETLSMTSSTSLFSALVKWRSIVRRDRPDLIVSFLVHANLLARVVGKLEKVSAIVSCHRVAETGRRARTAVDRATKSWADRHLCVSNGVARWVERTLREPTERIEVIPNGVDPSEVDRANPLPLQSFGFSPDDRLLLFAGRLHEQKGVDRLLDSLGRLKSAGVDLLKFGLLIAGDGPLRKALESLTSRLGLNDRVRFLGRRDDLPALYRSVSGFALSSRYEGMPNVVLEAMAARLPVIATRVEGTEDLVVDGQTGLLVDDERSLDSAIIDWLMNPDRHRRFGEVGRMRIESVHDYATMTRAYERSFESTLRSKRSSGDQ